MYKIIGADGKEYGPVTAEKLQQWMAEGRVTAQTQVRTESGGEWQPLPSFPELAAALPSTALPPTPRPKTSRLAKASLVMCYFGLVTCGLTALPGLILGIVGLVKINRSGGRLGGKGSAIAGISISGMMLLFQVVIVLPTLSSARELARSAKCLSNLKQLGLALAIYSDEYNQKLPSVDSWCDLLTNRVSSMQLYRCPSARKGKYHYAFNRNLSDYVWQGLSPNVVVLIDSGRGVKNDAVSGLSELGASPHYGQGRNVLFNDGHMEFVPKEKLSQLQWKPD